MVHPAILLQAEIYSVLAASTNLINALGSSAIFDDVPKNAKPPYVTFGDTLHFDWSTGTETGFEHQIALDVWSARRGRKEALNIIQIIQNELENLSETFDDYVIVNLTHESTEIVKDADRDLFRATLNLRITTELAT
ncbi:MAG: DUF3168 domain-containing protein [Pseudomonadota bacterium]